MKMLKESVIAKNLEGLNLKNELTPEYGENHTHLVGVHELQDLADNRDDQGEVCFCCQR